MPRKRKLKSTRRLLSELVPRSISHEHALKIVQETGAAPLSDFGIAELVDSLNQTLDVYANEQSIQTNKQSIDGLFAIRSAVKDVVNCLPLGSDVFRALVAAGDEFARQHGAHYGLSSRYYPAAEPKRSGSIQLGKVSAPSPPAMTDYRTEERLKDTLAYIEALSKWLHKIPRIREHHRRSSTIVWLVGGALPGIYEKTFDRKFGNARAGPGARFVRSVLSVGHVDAPISMETVKTYRTQWLNAQR